MTGTLCGAKPSKVTFSNSIFSSVRPAPFLMARSMVSRVTEALRAFSVAAARRGVEVRIGAAEFGGDHDFADEFCDELAFFLSGQFAPGLFPLSTHDSDG